MFDKLKDAVSDLMNGGDKVEKASDHATGAVDEAKAKADDAISEAAAGHISADSLKADAAELGGLTDKLKASAGDLSGIADQLGGVGQLKVLVSGLDFPIQKDQVVARLQESGVMDKIVELVKGYAGDRFESPEQILGLVKGLVSR